MWSCVCAQGKRSSSDLWITSRRNSLIWQWAPSKPGWHLQMYSLKTSPRLVGVMTSHDPSFLQGLGLQGPERTRKGKTLVQAYDQLCFSSETFLFRSTCLCQVAGVSTEAIRTDADEWILSYTRHACSSVMAKIHLTVVTWVEEIGEKKQGVEGLKSLQRLLKTILQHLKTATASAIHISPILVVYLTCCYGYQRYQCLHCQ